MNDVMAAPRPRVAQAGDCQQIQWLGQTRLRVLLDAAATGGQLSVIEESFGAGDTSPMHVHYHEDEMFWLLEGAMLAWAGRPAVRGHPRRHRVAAPRAPARLPVHRTLADAATCHPRRDRGHVPRRRLGPVPAGTRGLVGGHAAPEGDHRPARHPHRGAAPSRLTPASGRPGATAAAAGCTTSRPASARNARRPSRTRPPAAGTDPPRRSPIAHRSRCHGPGPA